MNADIRITASDATLLIIADFKVEAQSPPPIIAPNAHGASLSN